jgi:amino acid adenylation domain-containing protein
MKTNNMPGQEEISAVQNIEEKNYWLNRLSGELTRSYFPYDFNRVNAGAVQTEAAAGQLPAETCSRLAKMSGGADVRVFIILGAAAAVLLSKYTHHTDVIVGTVIFGQDGDKAGGPIINTVLPLRHGLDDGITFKEVLVRAGKTLMGADRYRNYPLEKLFGLLDMDASGDHGFPLFDTAVLFEGLHDRDTLRDIPVNTLFIFKRCGESGESIEVTLEYNSLRYRERTAGQILSHYMTLLRNALSDVDAPISGLDVLSGEERKEILFVFNDTKADYRGEKTMQRLFREQAARTPGHTAVTDNGNRLTYAELDRRTDRMARELQEKGLTPNRFAAVIMDRSLHMVVAVMAILKAGGAYVPLEPYLPDSRIITCLSSLEAEWVLTDRATQPNIDGFKGELPRLKHVFCLDDREAETGESPVPVGTSEDIAYVIFTSGTTGTPKGVVVKHRPVINLIEWVNGSFGVGESDKLLFVVSLSFDLSVYDIFGILASGGTVRVAGSEDVKSPERLLRIIFDEGITFWDSAPAALQLLVPYLGRISDPGGEKDDESNRSKLRLVFLSGDWIPVTMPDTLKGAFPGVKVIALGGATEAVVWSNYYPVETVDPDWLSIPYGRPIQNARYYILDRFLNPCPIGVEGDLYIGGECLASGYFNDELLTAGKFIDNPFSPGEKMYRTGDMARWFPDGVMEFLGRRDNQVKIRGYRIELGEIESQLLKHGDIKAAVVIARGEAKGDRYLCAYYTGERELLSTDLTAYLSGVLPPYMVPPYFVKLDRMPLTANGKVDRKRLPEPPKETVAVYTAPRDSIETELAGIWVEVLKLDREEVGIDGSFFDMGGHSLKATNLVVLIHERLNVMLPLADIFKTPTIRELAERIRGGVKDQFSAIEVVEKKQYYSTSSVQKRLYFMQKREPSSIVYNIPGLLVLDPSMDFDTVDRCLKHLIHRHRSLRTSFDFIDGRIVQRVQDSVTFDLNKTEVFGGPGTFFQKGSWPPGAIVQDFTRPFDLSTAPLMRTLLVRGEDRQTLLIDMHHIITDGVSVEILLEEFAILSGGGDLPTLRIHYNDFAEWQGRFLQSGKLDRQLEYWQEVLEGELPVLQFPTDFPRPALQHFAGGDLAFSVDNELRNRLKDIEDRVGATLFMVLLASFYVLLMKYAGQEDIIVGSPVAGRHHAGLLRIVGMFVNLLPLRNRPRVDMTFEEFLDEVNTNCIRAFENQDVPFDELVDRLVMKPDPSRHPLFDVCFFLQNFSEKQDIGWENDPVPDNTNKPIQFDMELGAYEMTGGISFALGYSRALFKPSTVENLARRYVRILEQVAVDPALRLRDIAVSETLMALQSDILAEEEGDFGI